MQAYNAHNQQLQKHCKKHLHKHVNCQMMDGNVYEGYLEHVDKQNIYLIVEVSYTQQPNPTQQHNSLKGKQNDSSYTMNQQRQYYGYGYGYPYPYPRPGFGFRRLILPLAFLTALSLVPY